MSVQLRSELLKLRTTRTAAWFLLVAVGLTLVGILAVGLSPRLDELADEQGQRTLFGAETSAILIATFSGLIAVTNEFRHGTIRPTLFFEPRRRVVLAAKLVSAAIAGVMFAVPCVVLSLAAGLAILAVRDVELVLTGPQLVALALGTIAASALSAMLGVTLGALIRNQVAALIALAAYALAIDAVVFAAAPSVGRYLPGQAGNALAGLPDENLLAPGPGAAVVLAWLLLFVAAATLRTDHGDV